MAEQFYYVYGITAAEFGGLPPLEGIGACGPVTVMADGDLQAIVSPTDELGPDPTAENTLAHHRVLAAVMERGPVVPFAFGFVAPVGWVRSLLDSAREECRELLPALAGTIEVGLRLTWAKDSFLADIETDELRAARQSLGAVTGGAAKALEMRVGDLAQQAAESRRAEYQQRIYEPLAAQAVAARLNDTAGPRAILNAAFLVDRKNEAAFDELVNQLCQPLAPRVDVRYTGPWPPYNFVTLRVRLEGGDA